MNDSGFPLLQDQLLVDVDLFSSSGILKTDVLKDRDPRCNQPKMSDGHVMLKCIEDLKEGWMPGGPKFTDKTLHNAQMILEQVPCHQIVPSITGEITMEWDSVSISVKEDRVSVWYPQDMEKDYSRDELSELINHLKRLTC